MPAAKELRDLQNDELEEHIKTARKEIFGLRVSGDSMIEAGILDGDYVVARAQPDANQGEMVVAGIPGGEATVKTYKREGDQIILVPANAAYEPMVFGSDEVTLFGKVVTIMRKV